MPSDDVVARYRFRGWRDLAILLSRICAMRPGTA